MDAVVQVDEDGDLCLEFGAGKMRVGFIVSDDRDRAGTPLARTSGGGGDRESSARNRSRRLRNGPPLSALTQQETLDLGDAA